MNDWKASDEQISHSIRNADDIKNGDRDLTHVLKSALFGRRRRFVPEWSVPNEILSMCLAPRWISRPARKPPVLGSDKFLSVQELLDADVSRPTNKKTEGFSRH